MTTPLRPLLTTAILAAATSHGQVIVNNDFDHHSSDVFFESSAGNFIDPTAEFGLPPHAGDETLQSDNGNESGTFDGLGIQKDLGGTMADQTYNVGFWIGYNMADQQPTPFSDFSTLYIGGENGTMTWTSTPTPTAAG